VTLPLSRLRRLNGACAGLLRGGRRRRPNHAIERTSSLRSPRARPDVPPARRLRAGCRSSHAPFGGFPIFWVRNDGRKYSAEGIYRDDHPELLLRSAHRTGNDRSAKLDTGMVGQSASRLTASDQCGGD
jgi:hypothetical protein